MTAYTVPQGQVTIIPAHTLRHDRQFLREANGNLPVNIAYYLQHEPALPPTPGRSHHRPSRAVYASGSKSVVSVGTAGGHGPMPLEFTSSPHIRRKYQYRNGYGPPVTRDNRYYVGYSGGSGVGARRSSAYSYKQRDGRVMRSYSAGNVNQLAVMPYMQSAPSYPPSSVNMLPYNPYKTDPQQWTYVVWWRLIIKLAQLLFAFAIIGLVVGPARGAVFHDWVTLVEAQGQLAVLILLIICIFITFGLLVSLGYADAKVWKNLDAMLNAPLLIIYLILGVVEAWYAACYPPYGINHPEVCYRAEWIAACVFCFLNFVLHSVDLGLGIRGGAYLL